MSTRSTAALIRRHADLIPAAVMAVGLVIGASSAAWYLAIGGGAGVIALYSSLLVGHVVVTVGMLLRPSRRRVALALLLAVLMWWPAVFGDHLWRQ